MSIIGGSLMSLPYGMKPRNLNGKQKKQKQIETQMDTTCPLIWLSNFLFQEIAFNFSWYSTGQHILAKFLTREVYGVEIRLW